MVNPIRGEVESNLFGRPMTFCLTLGALAEIEVAFGEDGLRPLLARFARADLSASDLVIILGAAARAGGAVISNDELADCRLHGGLEDACRLAGALLLACFEIPDATSHTPETP